MSPPQGRTGVGGLTFVLRVPADKDMKTEGFSLESCRSMIALMDVSFVSSSRGRLPEVVDAADSSAAAGTPQEVHVAGP